MSCDNCGGSQWLTDPTRGEMICESCGLTMENIYGVENTFDVQHTLGGQQSFGMENIFDLAAVTKTRKRGSLAAYRKQVEELSVLYEFNTAIQRRALELLDTFDQHRVSQHVQWPYAAFFAMYLAQAELRNGLTLREMLARQPDLDVHRFRGVRKRMLEIIPDCYTRVEDIIVLYCNSLDAPYYLAPMAEQIYHVCQEFLIGREHETTATACIALAVEASELPISRADIATVALIAQSTVDTVCRNIKRKLDPVLPPNQVDRIKSVKPE